MLSFYWKLFADNNSWIKKAAWWAVFWFIAGILVYYIRPDTAPRFLEFVQRIFREILGEKELALDFSTVWLIFQNNFEASLIVLFGGIVLGLLPLFSLAVNFFIVGYMLALFAGQRSDESIMMFLLSVIPHGIVELPLFIIVASFGLRLGWFWKIPGQTSNFKKLIICLKDNLKLVPLLAVGFFIAALIEVFASGRFVAVLFPSS